MSTPRAIGFVVAAVIAIATPAIGQEIAPFAPATYIDERAGLGLDAALARALDREPSLRAARAEVDIGRGVRQQAGLRPNPTITFERRDEPAGTDAQTSVGVAWPLDLYRRSARVQAADRELDATRFAVSDRERTLAAEVRMQYGAAAAAARDVAVADDVVAAAQRQWEIVRARVDAGAAPPIERDLLQVELRRAEAERLMAIGRADASLASLKPLLGMSDDEPLLLRDTLETLVAGDTVDVATAVGASVAMRADVREAEARVALAGARAEQARREGRADVSLFGTYMRMDAGFPQQGIGPAGNPERVRGRFNYVAAGAMLMVPMFNRNQGQVAAAEAERSGAEARREAAELAARADIASAQARVRQAQYAVTLYAGGVRSLARQNVEVVRQTFDLGRATVFDVLAEQRRYLEIEQEYTSALREAWDARAALKRARGESK